MEDSSELVVLNVQGEQMTVKRKYLTAFRGSELEQAFNSSIPLKSTDGSYYIDSDP